MQALNYSYLRKNLSATLDKVNQNHQPILVTRQNSKPAIIMSLEDFNAYEETAYLMASPKNMHRLNDSIHQLETGQVKRKKLIDV